MDTRLVKSLLRWSGGWLGWAYFHLVRLVFASVNLFFHRQRATRVRNPLLLESAISLARRIRAREIRSTELVDALAERLGQVSYLNAVVIRNVEACREEAAVVDRRVASGSAPSEEEAPFLGVPFTLKDCIFVKGLRCTAGIPVRGERAPEEQDANAVRNLRLAGAIGPLAVTNVSEVCMWWESNNSLFGRSRNAYDSRRIVGGSSGGEGALLSAGGSVFGIGSDIGGSIRMPAFFNGVFGHKPSREVISLHGSYPTCHGYQKIMCTKGPLCRYAEDLGPMLLALGGPAAASQLAFPASYDLKNLRIYYMEGLQSPLVTPLDPEMRQAMLNAVSYFQTRFGVPCVRVDLPIIHRMLPIFLFDLDQDDAPSFARALTDYEYELNVWAEAGRLLLGQSRHTVPGLGLAFMEKLTPNPTPAQKRKLVGLRERLSAELESLLGKHGILFFPPHPTPAPFHNQPILTPFNFLYTAIFNSLALPVTQIPMGLSSSGVPLGVQAVGAMYNDHLGIAVAKELERAFGGWQNFPH